MNCARMVFVLVNFSLKQKQKTKKLIFMLINKLILLFLFLNLFIFSDHLIRFLSDNKKNKTQ